MSVDGATAPDGAVGAVCDRPGSASEDPAGDYPEDLAKDLADDCAEDLADDCEGGRETGSAECTQLGKLRLSVQK
ncbi:hypothetical protein [Brevibacterium sp. S111]|uniref:hypothetical protein n=1 Tax=unclassified Brevibacterium TaxID=2614124 RepID=UPI001080F4F0|nr:hypothetical protein [Brevibacterium sp. S111]TGD09485.1 hypothetical protein EB836_14530 [Brevibacterium sp. S111]